MGFISKIFGAKTPKVETKVAAPELDEPIAEVKSPDLGGQTQEEKKRRRGKSSLTINQTQATPRSTAGLNIG